MIIATWVLLAVLSCLCQALAPPVTLALESNTRDPAVRDDSVVALPTKRILKYFLPSAQAWSTHGAGGGAVAVPTGPEGNKRGYGDRNFLRFGRSGDAVKKESSGRNFLRFGRGGNEEYENDEDDLSSIEKRNRNFLRFGRDRNFLRFGRSDPEQFGLEAQPLEFSRGLQEDDGPVEDERADLENYLRYSRPDKNFLRFGRTYDKNFLRFGRSVDAQTICDDCEEDNLNKPLKRALFSSSSSSFPATRVSGEQNVDGNYQLVKEAEARPLADTDEKKEVRRSKREAPTYSTSSIRAPHADFDTSITGPQGDFDSSVSGPRSDFDPSFSGPHGDFDSSISGPHAPDFWGRDNQHSDEQEDESSASLGLDELQEVAKRPYSRDFLRFGRDRNFLRFGKRFDGAPPESDMMMMTPLHYTSKRVSHNNFLRFG